MITFWEWLLKSSGCNARGEVVVQEGKPPGIKRYVTRGLLIHAAVGIVLAYLVPMSIELIAQNMLLPLGGLLIGLSLAWGGNAVALMQTVEINLLADYRDDGMEGYVYTFQSAILVLLIAISLWGVTAIGLFSESNGINHLSVLYYGIKFILLAWTSFTIRECWHVVLGAQYMILMRRRIRKSQITEKSNGEDEAY